MTFDESNLKTRFDQAVGTLHPDVSALTRSSTVAGQRLQRRRRVSVAAGAAATAVLAVGGVAYLGTPGDLLGSPSKPADPVPTVIQPAVEASTPRGLAAAVMSHIDGAERFGASGSIENKVEGVSAPVLMANLGYSFGDDKSRYVLSAAATTDLAMASTICTNTSKGETCSERTLDDGTQVYLLQETPKPGSGPEVTTVIGVRTDQVVAITLLGASAPYGAEMPLSPAELQAIATDPLVGIETSAAMNEHGKDIDSWGGDVYTMAMALTGHSTPPSSADPQRRR